MSEQPTTVALPPRAIDLTGQPFDRWVVVRAVGTRNRNVVWECRCKCGTVKPVSGAQLRRGRSRSCGCIQRETARAGRLTHGHSRTRSEYRIWIKMRRRCKEENETGYEAYGGRGIRVCERWDKSFTDFFADVGPRPSKKHTLDRIDTNGHYEPGNCRWATRKVQQRNRQVNHTLAYNGETLCLAEWAERLGMSLSGLRGRLRRGWTIERIVTEPRHSQYDQWSGKSRK